MKSSASKHLDRVSKLLNQAERAPEGSAEREAFMEKAIALSQANSIDLALARAHQANKEKVEQIEERRIQTGQWVGGRQSNNTKWLAELLTEISPPNDVRCLISKGGFFVWLVGFPSDLDVVERLYASLAVQMVSEADALIKKGAHKRIERVRRTKRIENPHYIPESERYWGDPENNDPFYTRKTIEVNDDDEEGNPVYIEKPIGTHGRVWRQNFYQGFINRVTARMWEERRAARKAAEQRDEDNESQETSLALRDKESELKANWEERIKGVRGTYTGPEPSSTDYEGLEEGQRAGARATLGREARVDNEQRKEIG